MDILHPAHDMQPDLNARVERSSSRATVSSLPNEVLSAIFEAVCLLSPPEQKRSSFEILLSHVTRRWRSVALNTPQLWTKIHIDSSFSYFRMTEAYLSRSGALSLDIHIIVGGQASPKLNVAGVNEMLTAHIHRWSRLRLHCAWQVDLDRLLSPMQTSTAPHLRRIDISLENDPDPDMVSRCIFSGGAPSLTHIHLRNIALRTCLPPLESVTHLRLDEPERTIRTNPRQLTSMLCGLTTLTHLVLSGDYRDDGATPPSIEMPSLRSLHTLNFTDPFPTMLNMISAPQLECLLLEEICPEDTDGYLVDLASASPKFPLLQSLIILPRCNQGFAPSTWINIMRAFPTITCMTLSCNAPYDLLLTLCVPQDPSASHSSTIPWQNLHTLTLIVQLWWVPYATLVLCNAVTARVTTGYPIQKLQLSDGILSGLVDKLEWLRARVVVERTILFQNKPRHTFFADLLDWV